jgi:hypothetical protein
VNQRLDHASSPKTMTMFDGTNVRRCAVAALPVPSFPVPLPRGPEPKRRTVLLYVGVLLLYIGVYAARGVSEPGPADGFYSYLYARSLAFDHDLHFENDYALCGDPWAQGIDRGTGRADNPGYAGPALFWTPLVAVARVVVSFPPDTPAAVRGGCRGPIARFALSITLPLAALAIALAYRTARRFARAGPALAAAVLFAVASNLPQYGAIFVSSSHVYECFSAALLSWLSVRAIERPSLGRWALVGTALGVAALQRLTDVALVAVPLALLASAPLARSKRAVSALIVLAGGAAGVGATLALYTYLYGSPFLLPQGRHFVHLGHAHPWLLLFAPHGGLFFTTPIAYLGFVGLGVAARRPEHRLLAIGAAVAIGAIVWTASAPLDWHGKATLGARRLVVLIPLFVVFAAIALDALVPFFRRRRGTIAMAALAALLALPTAGGALGTTTGEVPLEGGSQAQIYGGGARALFGVLDANVGDLAILPAEAFYAVRFGLPMRTFRAATTDRFYRRSYRDMSWEPNVLDFGDATLREASSGMSLDGAGLRLMAPDSRVVFTAGWPWATEGTFSVVVSEESTLAITIGTTFHTCTLGTWSLVPGPAELAFAIPSGCFDSGLVELRFRSSRPAAVLLRRLVLEDRNVYAPPH